MYIDCSKNIRIASYKPDRIVDLSSPVPQNNFTKRVETNLLHYTHFILGLTNQGTRVDTIYMDICKAWHYLHGHLQSINSVNCEKLIAKLHMIFLMCWGGLEATWGEELNV